MNPYKFEEHRTGAPRGVVAKLGSQEMGAREGGAGVGDGPRGRRLPRNTVPSTKLHPDAACCQRLLREWNQSPAQRRVAQKRKAQRLAVPARRAKHPRKV